MKAKKTKRSAKQVSSRIAVPADIYISIELPGTTSKARAFAIAAARLDEACAGEPFMNLKRNFSESEHVLVYLGRDSQGNVRVSDCSLEDIEDPMESTARPNSTFPLEKPPHNFSTISGEDWKRALKESRSRRNAALDLIKAAHDGAAAPKASPIKPNGPTTR